MGFLVPAFLAGLAALGIPLWIHLRDRNEQAPIRFPSLMFLVRLPIRTSDRRRVTDLPLLLLRALAVALLVLAFSRPWVGRVRPGGVDAGARSVVLLLDRSMSMGYAGTWEAARDSARALLASLGARDHVALVLFDEQATVALDWTQDRAAARALVDGTAPVQRSTRIAAALRAGRGLLTTAPTATGEIVVVSDLQRSGLQGVAGLELPVGVRVRSMPAAPRARANAAIETVEARRSASGDRLLLRAQAKVVTRDLPGARRVRATLVLGGREVATRDVSLPAIGALTVVFEPVAAPTGAVEGEVRLEGDALAGDDRFHFALTADDALRVIVVVPTDLQRDETLYLERALGIGRAPSVTVEKRRAGTLDAEALGRARVVVLWDVPPPNGAAGAALDAFVQGGGGLILHAGTRLGGRRIEGLAGIAAVEGIADRRASTGGVLGDVRLDHPVFAPFRAMPAALGAPRTWRYPRLTPTVGTEVLARYDDGLPAILEREQGEGRVLALALALDGREGDFPLQPAFLPLVRRLVLHGSGEEATPLARATGESWTPRGVRRTPVIVAPGGDLLRPAEDGGEIVVTLERPGVYAAYEGRVDGAPRARVAVNVGAAESDLVAADPQELLLGVTTAPDSLAPGEVSRTGVDLERRQQGWRYVLVAVALLLAGEAYLAARGWRGRARRATVDSMERAQVRSEA